MADKFTANKLAWLDRVMLDPEITHFDFRFCYWIASRADRATGEATAFQDTIAGALDATPRGIQKSAQRLADRGYVKITSRRGHGVKNSYAPVFSNTNSGSGLLEEIRTEEQSNANGCSNKYERPSVEASLSSSLVISPEGREGARSTLIRNDFRLDDQTYNWAVERLGSNEAVDRSVSRFVNHHLSVVGHHSKSRNWQAKARNWIDDDAKEKSGGVIAASDRLLAKVKSFEAGSSTDAEWDGVLSMYAKRGQWTRHVHQFGSPPGEPGCFVPKHLLIKHGIIKETAA
jgi:hypothetical protein